jgi:hypothetical protein
MRAKNAFTRTVASESSSGSAARSAARSSFARLRLVVVTIAGLRAPGVSPGRTSRLSADRFVTIAGTWSPGAQPPCASVVVASAGRQT